MTPEALLDGGPDSALGVALTDEVITRAIATSASAAGAWVTGRATGRRRRADTIGLAALVETQLGQTMLMGGRNPVVLASMLASMGVLAGVVQTPGISQFFGCTPMGPMGWTIATGAAAIGTATSVALAPVVRSVRTRASGGGESRAKHLAPEPLDEKDGELRERQGEDFLHENLPR